MTEQSGRILVANAAGTLVIRLEGDIRYSVSTSFRDFLNASFTDPAIGDILIDLTGALNIDSTNLGLLAKVADYSRRHRHHPSVIVSDNKDINELLANVGFDRVFTLVPAFELPPTRLEELRPEPANRDQLAVLLLETHQALMGLNDENKAMFSDLVDALRESVGRGAKAAPH